MKERRKEVPRAMQMFLGAANNAKIQFLCNLWLIGDHLMLL
jgi:hypothetical protein